MGNFSLYDSLGRIGANFTGLTRRDYQLLLVVQEIYRQQLWMFDNKKNSIEDRIVSLTQPYLRPIVRGKARQNTEFGAKISASYYDGLVFLDHLSWDNFEERPRAVARRKGTRDDNESKDLKAQVEAFKNYTGHYPDSVHVDQIYRSRENRAWCKERGIRISGPPLGRPKKSVSLEEKKQAQLDARIRSETAIAISFLVMNLNTLFSRGYYLLFCLFLGKPDLLISNINSKWLKHKQI